MASCTLVLWVVVVVACVGVVWSEPGYEPELDPFSFASAGDVPPELSGDADVYAANGAYTTQFAGYTREDTRLQSATPESHGTTPADVRGFDLYEPDDESYKEDEGESLSLASQSSSSSCQSGNPIDDCWRCDAQWASRRQSLADCVNGFGKGAVGGRNGQIYVVTSDKDDDPANPAPGTLRYGATRDAPLWIIFAKSMTIKLKLELMMTSFKTIDGRGVTVHIAGGGGLKMQNVNNIIVHNIAIHDIVVTGPGKIMQTEKKVGKRNKCDGDAIAIFQSKNIWIDHCYFAKAADGLVDVIRGSDGISITNNYFTNHDKVMLFGASKKDTMDKDMHVTVAYNKFGPGLIQRLPRVRFGSVHVVNNEYTSGWKMYALAGSEAPTILSQGNVYNSAAGPKQVTKRIDDGGPSMGGPAKWNWKSEGDSFLSGAYFSSVVMSWSSQSYSNTVSCSARPATMVPRMCRDAGPLTCTVGSACG